MGESILYHIPGIGCNVVYRNVLRMNRDNCKVILTGVVIVSCEKINRRDKKIENMSRLTVACKKSNPTDYKESREAGTS